MKCCEVNATIRECVVRARWGDSRDTMSSASCDSALWWEAPELREALRKKPNGGKYGPIGAEGVSQGQSGARPVEELVGRTAGTMHDEEALGRQGGHASGAVQSPPLLAPRARIRDTRAWSRFSDNLSSLRGPRARPPDAEILHRTHRKIVEIP